jgi:deoxyguanosine kinase
MAAHFICVEGNIGSGKTTFAKTLATESNSRLFLECFEENPFLPEFYKNQARYAFQTEMFFLSDRFKQIQSALSDTDQLIIFDYSFYRCDVFARTNLSPVEYTLFAHFYTNFLGQLPKPDLLIFLDLPTQNLLENIGNRARPMEKNIDANYLESVGTSYMQVLSELSGIKKIYITDKLFLSNAKPFINQVFSILNQQT